MTTGIYSVKVTFLTIEEIVKKFVFQNVRNTEKLDVPDGKGEIFSTKEEFKKIAGKEVTIKFLEDDVAVDEDDVYIMVSPEMVIEEDKHKFYLGDRYIDANLLNTYYLTNLNLLARKHYGIDYIDPKNIKDVCEPITPIIRYIQTIFGEPLESSPYCNLFLYGRTENDLDTECDGCPVGVHRFDKVDDTTFKFTEFRENREDDDNDVAWNDFFELKEYYNVELISVLNSNR